jgi:magnesium-transporting ATPase (P-type)
MTQKDNEMGQWHAIGYRQVLENIDSSQNGLSSGEAKKRLGKYGLNQIKRKKKDGAFKLLWRQINNPLIWVLIGSSTLATFRNSRLVMPLKH